MIPSEEQIPTNENYTGHGESSLHTERVWIIVESSMGKKGYLWYWSDSEKKLTNDEKNLLINETPTKHKG